nr:flavodoxin family protein [uncultured Methanobrevibacter sp.]
MKAIVINAGPKRRDYNAKLAKSALSGAESVGAEVEYVDLYKYDLHGCMICTVCKNEDKVGKCYWKDDLSPLIERILDCDCLLISVPIFFTEPASHFRALVERLIYCIVSYKTGNAFSGRINVGLFYTLNYSADYFEKSVRPHLKSSEDLFGMFNGDVEIHSFRTITIRESSQANDDLKDRKKEFERHSNKVFEISANLCS